MSLKLLVCLALVACCLGATSYGIEHELKKVAHSCCNSTCSSDKLSQLNELLSVYKLSGVEAVDRELVKKAENALGGRKCNEVPMPTKNANGARVAPVKPAAIPSLSITCYPWFVQLRYPGNFNVSCTVLYANIPKGYNRTFVNRLYYPSARGYYLNCVSCDPGLAYNASSGSYNVLYSVKGDLPAGYYTANTSIAIVGYGSINASFVVTASYSNSSSSTGNFNATSSGRVTTGSFNATTGNPFNYTTSGGSGWSTTGGNWSTSGSGWTTYNPNVTTGFPFNFTTSSGSGWSTTGGNWSTTGVNPNSTTTGGWDQAYLYIFCPSSVYVTQYGFNLYCSVSYGNLNSGAFRFTNYLVSPTGETQYCSYCNTTGQVGQTNGYFQVAYFVNTTTQGYYTVSADIWYGGSVISNSVYVYASTYNPNVTSSSTSAGPVTTTGGSTTGGAPSNGSISIFCPYWVNYPMSFNCTVYASSNSPIYYIYDYASPYLPAYNDYAWPNNSYSYTLQTVYDTNQLTSDYGYVTVQIYASFYVFGAYGGSAVFNLTVFGVPINNGTTNGTTGWSTGSGSTTGGWSTGGSTTGGNWTTSTTGGSGNNTQWITVSCPYAVPSSDYSVLCSVTAYSPYGIQYIGAYGEPMYCSYNCEEYAYYYTQYTKYVYFYGLNAGQTSVITGYFYDQYGFYAANTTVYVYSSNGTNTTTTGGYSTSTTGGPSTTTGGGGNSSISVSLWCQPQVAAGQPTTCYITTYATTNAVYYVLLNVGYSYDYCDNCSQYPYPCPTGYCSYNVTIYSNRNVSSGYYPVWATAYDYNYAAYTSPYSYVYVYAANNTQSININGFWSPSVVYPGTYGQIQFNVSLYVSSTYGLQSATIYYKKVDSYEYLNSAYQYFWNPSTFTYFSMYIQNNQSSVTPGTYCPVIYLTDTSGYSITDENQTCIEVSFITCDAGYYISNITGDCVACPQGFYSSSPNSNYCDACPAGFTSSCLLGATGCVACPAGSSSSEGVCEKCAPGTFSGYSGQSYCAPCQAGTYTNNTGSFGCNACQGGTFSNAGASYCSICPGGTYSSYMAEICTPCSDGHYSYPGSFYCYTCPANTYAVSGAESCTPCPPGTKSPPGSYTCYQAK